MKDRYNPDILGGKRDLLGKRHVKSKVKMGGIDLTSLGDHPARTEESCN